jgi:glycosyltransferase involved in cell wall biosynthesis
MRIAITGDGTAPGVIYRANHPGNELARRGHSIVWPDDAQGSLTYERVLACDALYVYRFRDRPIQDIARLFLEHGVALVWDNDDDLSAYPPGGALDATQGPGFRAEVFRDSITMAKMAQVATFASPALVDLYRSQGVTQAQAIENAPQATPMASTDDGSIVIGWVAGAEHTDDLARVPIVEALREIQRRHAHVRVETLGVQLALDDRYEHIPFLPFDDMLRRLTTFHIGIAPIADTPFNRARSSIKIKEYAAAGVPWLASPLPPYAPYASGCGGRLVPDDGWIEALAALVRSAGERRHLAAQGQTWAASQRITVMGDQWEQAFELAVSRVRGRTSSPPANPWRVVSTRRPAPRRS